MSTFTIDSADPRTVRAVLIAAGAALWKAIRQPDGHTIYCIPSQSTAGVVYTVDEHTCSCNDFQGHAAEAAVCKHVLAVRLYRVLVEGQRTIIRAERRLQVVR